MRSANTRVPTIDGCNPSDPTVKLQIRFADTPLGSFVDVPITVKNGGCPNLFVQDVKVTSAEGYSGSQAWFLLGVA